MRSMPSKNISALQPGGRGWFYAAIVMLIQLRLKVKLLHIRAGECDFPSVWLHPRRTTMLLTNLRTTNPHIEVQIPAKELFQALAENAKAKTHPPEQDI